jgi:Derlin-2/3
MIMLGIFVLLPLPLIVPSLGLPFLSSSLVFMLLYLWSRENPNANTSIMGFVTLKAFYLPWGMMAATAMMGGSILPDFLGVIAGHLYYFLTVLQPRAGGPHVIFTPAWVRALCYHAFGDAGAGGGGGGGGMQRPPARAFGTGRGRRLGSE